MNRTVVIVSIPRKRLAMARCASPWLRESGNSSSKLMNTMIPATKANAKLSTNGVMNGNNTKKPILLRLVQRFLREETGQFFVNSLLSMFTKFSSFSAIRFLTSFHVAGQFLYSTLTMLCMALSMSCLFCFVIVIPVFSKIGFRCLK